MYLCGDGLLYLPPRLYSTKYARNAQYACGPWVRVLYMIRGTKVPREAGIKFYWIPYTLVERYK